MRENSKAILVFEEKLKILVPNLYLNINLKKYFLNNASILLFRCLLRQSFAKYFQTNL